MEEMKRAFIFLIVFCLLSLPVSATVLNPQITILDYVIYRYANPVNGYMNLSLSPWNTGNMSITAGTNINIGVGVKTSYIMPNTFYRVSFKINQLGNGTANELGNDQSGVIDINNLTNLRFLPLREWENVDATNPTVRVDVAISETDWNKSLIPSDYVTAYWDHTLDTYYILFYIPEDFYNQNVELFMQTFLMFTLGNTGTYAGGQYRLDVQALTQAEIDDPIYNVLQEIKNNLASSGGGLSEEDIKNAVEDALDDHDQELEDRVESALGELQNKIDELLAPYTGAVSDINNAIGQYTDILNNTSTNAVLTFPAGYMPNGEKLWNESSIDLGAAWFSLPEQLRAAVTVVSTFFILYNVVDQVVFVLKFIILGKTRSEEV